MRRDLLNGPVWHHCQTSLSPYSGRSPSPSQYVRRHRHTQSLTLGSTLSCEHTLTNYEYNRSATQLCGTGSRAVISSSLPRLLLPRQFPAIREFIIKCENRVCIVLVCESDIKRRRNVSHTLPLTLERERTAARCTARLASMKTGIAVF